MSPGWCPTTCAYPSTAPSPVKRIQGHDCSPPHDGLAALVAGGDLDVRHRLRPPELLGDPDLPGLCSDPRTDRGRVGERALHPAADPGRAGAVPHLRPDAVRHRLRA